MEDTSFHGNYEKLAKRIYQNPNMLPSRYVYVLTNQCNLRCDFCFQDKESNKNSMTADEWINLTNQLPEYARVTLTGGEPLKFKEFDSVFEYIAKKFDCNLITNGLLLNEKKIDFLLSYPNFKVLSLSIDDIGNKIRGVSAKSWTHLENMVNYFFKEKNATSSDCILDVKTMVLDENAENLFDIYKYLIEDLKVDTHTFQFLKGSSIQHADKMFSLEHAQQKSSAYVYHNFDLIKKQLKKVQEYNSKHGLSSFLHPKITSLDYDLSLEDLDRLNESDHDSQKYSPCKFFSSSVHINSDGILFPCLAIGMGNVRDTSLKEIIEGEEFSKFKQIIKEQSTIEACNRCGWLRPIK
jgi:MoaA/NifB/PqqE/SkfB family radical SAM enzyme